jgi:hypothetical protein
MPAPVRAGVPTFGWFSSIRKSISNPAIVSVARMKVIFTVLLPVV